MKKNFKTLLWIIVLVLLFPLGVNAETFKDGDKTYIFEKLDLSCAGDRDYYTIDKDGNYIFLDYDEDFNYKPIKVTKDNKCSEMTNQEILDVLNSYTHDYYYLDLDLNEIHKETRYEEIGAYVKITTEEFNINDKYYTYDSEDEEYNEVSTNDVNDIDKYYRYTYFGPAKSAEIDEDIIYFEATDGNTFKKLEINDSNKEDIESNITKYYVEQNERRTDVVVGTITDEVATILSNPSFVKVDVVGTTNPNVYYFLVVNNFDPQPIYSIYDQNGELLFDNVLDFSYLDIGLFSIGRGDKVELYNLDNKLFYTTDKIVSLYEVEYYDNTSLLDGSTGRDFSYYTLKLSKGNIDNSNAGDSGEAEMNPDTSDNIVTSFALGGIALIGVVGIAIYLKNKNNKKSSKSE